MPQRTSTASKRSRSQKDEPQGSYPRQKHPTGTLRTINRINHSSGTRLISEFFVLFHHVHRNRITLLPDQPRVSAGCMPTSIQPSKVTQTVCQSPKFSRKTPQLFSGDGLSRDLPAGQKCDQSISNYPIHCKDEFCCIKHHSKEY